MSLRVPGRTGDLGIESRWVWSAGAAGKYMPPHLALQHTHPQEFLRHKHGSDFEPSLAKTAWRERGQKTVHVLPRNPPTSLHSGETARL